jgi:class 3 adenylate cyclase
MTFQEVLAKVIDWLQRSERVSYGAIKRQFELDDEYLDDLKEAILFAHPQVVDEEGRGLVWTSEASTPLESISTHIPSEEVPQANQNTQAETQPAAPYTPDAELRQLTVMFCDLAESTRLSGQLDPEDYREVVRAYQSACDEAIQSYDAYIAQHLGDGMLIYFGFPQAHDDDALRAVRAGLDILEAIGSLNAQLERDKGIRLEVRIGVHTGPVVVGEIGAGTRQELLALGETPNIAARIQAIAQLNTVAVSSTTFKMVEGYFTVEDLGFHTLKGIAAPMQVRSILGESGVQSRLDVAVTRGLTPLVGRESEAKLFFERWDQVKAGMGQVVLLTGEGGIGKSRLIQVMKDHIAGENHTQIECRSSPYYQNTALYPMVDMWERICAFTRVDTPSEKLEKLEQALQPYRCADQETVSLLATLLSIPLSADQYPPLNLSPQRQRQKTLETLLAIMLEQAEQNPVLFILEDLHWTDPSTLELLDLLIDRTATETLFVILTCRPTFQPSWDLRTHVMSLALNRLTDAQIKAMVDRLISGNCLPTEVVHQIVVKTDGVPLFIEEMTKAIVESGVLQNTPRFLDGTSGPTGYG